jgi:nucleotide-binding universal stress UspA family protein
MLSYDATRPSLGDHLATVTIVVGIDGSDSSLRALAHAVGIARRTNGRLIAVYARNPLQTSALALGFASGGCEVVLEAATDADDSALAQLQSLIAVTERDTGVCLELACVLGDPARAITQLATEAMADLVIVGKSERKALRWFGSVSRRLSRNAHWPVTVVP